MLPTTRSDTLIDRFDTAVRRHADVVALEVGGQVLTYGELAERVDAHARALPELRPGARIALPCHRTAATYVSYLAVLRAGATVVPLCPDGPRARTGLMCATAEVSGVLVPDETGVPALYDLGARPAGSSGDVDPGDRVAYVLFTSGSTGRPKGVPIRHRNVVPYVDHGRAQFGVGPGSRASQTFELTFDPSVHDLFVTWSAGGTVVVAQPQDLLTPVQFVNRHRLTHWFSTPSVVALAARLRGLAPGSMPDLEWSLFAGEQLTVDRAREWAAAAPRSVVENLYGPTELTITCTRYRLPSDPSRWPETANRTVPIGQPYPHLDVAVVDDTGREADDGELWVRGSQRFDGYLPDPDRPGTTPAPRPHRAGDDWYRTGDRVQRLGTELVHLGRLDDQVKIHGYRVEPSEVEAVLSQLAGVNEVAVVVVATGDGSRLHAFCRLGDDLDAVEQQARDRLPGYMVPTRFHAVDTFPTGPHGKLDRDALLRHTDTASR